MLLEVSILSSFQQRQEAQRPKSIHHAFFSLAPTFSLSRYGSELIADNSAIFAAKFWACSSFRI
jgi:hypothetical protein